MKRFKLKPFPFLTAVFLIFLALIMTSAAFCGVRIDSPANGETVGGIVPITLSYDGTADLPVYYVYTSLTGGYNEPCVLSGSRTFYWDSTYTPDWTLKPIQAYAVWAGSPTGAYDNITITVYNPSPQITITSPLSGEIISPDSTTLAVTVQYNNVWSNYQGIKWISLTLDARQLAGLYVFGYPQSGSYTWNIDISDYALGPYTLQAYCSDAVNKSSFSQEINIIIGNPPPAVDHTKEAPHDKTTTVGEPINVANGNMFTSQTDISIPAADMPLELSRAYNSQDEFSGQFGFGWRSNFDIVLSENPDKSVTETDKDAVHTIYTVSEDGYIPSAGKYSKLNKNPDNTYTILRKNGTKLYFDTQGRLTKLESRNNNSINILRDTNGAISEITDSFARKLLFTNDSEGRVIQVSDPANRVWKYEYDSNANPVKITDPLNNETFYQYDANHKFIHETSANNHNLNFEYDSLGRAYHSWQDGNNNEIILSFDPDNKTTTTTYSLGNTTKYEYNTYGLVTKITDSQNNTQNFVWDANLNKTSSTDQNSNITIYTYDNRGNLRTVHDPLNNTTTFSCEPDFNLVKTVTDAEGNVTTYDYDLKGNLIKLTDASGNSTTNTYDALGQLISSTGPKNQTTTFTYDQYGNLASTTDALGSTTVFNYDKVGNRTQIKDAKNNLTQFIYNELNQLIQIVYPDNSLMTYTYDGLGNKTSVTDNALNTTTYIYDLNNKVTSITNPLGKTTLFVYDTEGNLIKATDQNQHDTTYQYDSLNRLISQMNALGLTKTYTYDPAGNRASVTDAKGNTIIYEYDSLSRLKIINYPDGHSISFIYDALGRRINMSDIQGIANYIYDNLGRLTKVDGPKDNDILQYTYDELGNRTSLIMPDGKIISYTYDSLNRLSSITDSSNKTTNYTYDETGNPVEITYPNNIKAVYSFDALHRLTHLINQNQTTQEKLSEFGYTYDPAGRKSRVELMDGITDYQYDSLGELIEERNTAGNNPYLINYEYDSAGNRTRMVKDGTEHLYAYNEANQLNQEDITGPAVMPITVTGRVTDANGIQSLTVNNNIAALNNNNFTCRINLSVGENTITVRAVDSAGNTATKTLRVIYNQNEQILYLYDNNGNLIRKQSSTEDLTLGYDYENRLNNLVSAGMNISYGYDGDGRRVTAVDNQNITKYLYDDKDVIQENKGIEGEITSYLRNPNAGGGIGGIINTRQGLNPEVYYSYDGIGSVVNLSDTSSVNLQAYSYDAFGNLLTQPNPDNTRQFLTKETDSSGLIYFGARYYDPRTGRFITQDPSGMIDGPNLYMYAGNNPVNLVDLWGLCKERSWWENLDIYLIEVGNVMVESYPYALSMQDIFGTVYGITGGISQIGLIPRGIGYSNSNFLMGGRIAYRWANQYGSGVKLIGSNGMSLLSKTLNSFSLIVTGYNLGATFNSYYWGYLNYKEKYRDK